MGNYKFHTNTVKSHELEQVKLRQFLCQDCGSNGSCLVCKCKTPNVFYAPAKIDAKNKWAQFLNKEQWEALKNNIDKYVEFFNLLKQNA